MKRLVGVHNRLRAVASTALPSLRVIGMAYAGLIGVGATALVVSVAFLPVPPVLQQATQPAREAVVNLVQPATDVVTSLINTLPTPREPRFLFMPAPQVALAGPSTSPDPVAEDITPPSADPQPVAAARVAPPPSTQLALAPVAKASVSRSSAAEMSDPVAEDVPVDEPQQAVDATVRVPVREVAAAPAAPVQEEANVEAPRPLPPLPGPTEAPWQAKARLDVENQAAIDAAKASVVRRKAEADTANQAAIDVRKSTTAYVAAAPTATEMADTVRPPLAVAQATTPAAPAVPTVTPQTLVSANADNQTLIDAAKASKARARADANAANQAAIDAAKAPRAPVKPTPSPTLQPVPATPTPAPTAEPTPTRAPVNAADPVSVAILDDQPIDLEEMPVTLALDKASDVSR